MARSGITSRQFKKALQVLGQPTGGQRRFLKAHYRATGRVQPMWNLATAAGYRAFTGVNLQYGWLARRIGNILGHPLPRPRIGLLVEFVDPPRISNRNYVLHMKPAFASALRSAGWVQ